MTLTFREIRDGLGAAVAMTGIFRDVLRRHFLSEGTIEQIELRRLIWADSELTSILIESVGRWDPRTTERRPALLIKRNAYTNQTVSIGDRVHATTDEEGNTRYVTQWLGSHTIFAVARTEIQADYLANETQRELTEFGPELLKTLGLHRFKVGEVGAADQLEEASENFVVPITVGYIFEERWRIYCQAPRLRAISLKTLVRSG